MSKDGGNDAKSQRKAGSKERKVIYWRNNVPLLLDSSDVQKTLKFDRNNYLVDFH